MKVLNTRHRQEADTFCISVMFQSSDVVRVLSAQLDSIYPYNFVGHEEQCKQLREKLTKEYRISQSELEAYLMNSLGGLGTPNVLPSYATDLGHWAFLLAKKKHFISETEEDGIYKFNKTAIVTAKGKRGRKPTAKDEDNE